MRQRDQALAVARVVALHRALGEVGDGARAPFARRLGEGRHLLEGRAARRHRAAELIDVRRRVRGREAGRPRRHRVAHEGAHVAELVLGGRAFGRALAHDEAAERRVPDVDRGVDPEPCLEEAEERREGVPLPREPVAQHARRHALDLREETAQPVVVLARAGGDRVAAVARYHRRDAVEAGRGGVGVEGELRVVVGVHVDDARHDHEAVAVEGLPRARESPDVGDQPEPDADVGSAHGQPRAVHHRAALDDQVEAHASPFTPSTRCT